MLPTPMPAVIGLGVFAVCELVKDYWLIVIAFWNKIQGLGKMRERSVTKLG